jgi:hypothetical protein
MKNFLQDVRAGIHSADFVSRFRTKTVKQAILFVSKLLATGILLTSAIYLGILVPGLAMVLNGETVAKYYPHGLEVTITDGVVSTNQATPFVLKDTFSPASERRHANLLVIDTAATDTIKAFAAYDTRALVTRDSLIVEKNPTEISVMSLAKAKAVHITEERVEGWVDDSLPTLWGLAAAFAVFAALFMFLVALAFYLLILFPLAALVRPSSKKRGWDFTFNEAYVLSAYLLTLSMVADIVMGLFFKTVPLLITLALFVVVYFLNIKDKPAALAETTPLP